MEHMYFVQATSKTKRNYNPLNLDEYVDTPFGHMREISLDDTMASFADVASKVGNIQLRSRSDNLRDRNSEANGE